MYLDLSTGSTTTRNDSRQDATSTHHAHCPRHRRPSRFTHSLPLPSLDPAACACADRALRLPVASATFRHVCFSDRLADQLAHVLLRHRSFRILTFVKCRRVDACLRRVGRNLVDAGCNAARSRLSRLHLRLSPLDHVDVVAELAEALPHPLHALSLTGCSIMSTGCAAVVRGLVAAGSRRLSELDLGFNDVNDVTSLSDALTANCSLRSLRLRGNAIGPAAGAALFGSLRRNCRLELLDVSGNPLGERRRDCNGVDLWRTAAEALLSNRSLRELKLERCSLGVEACSALGRVLAANTTLAGLDVSMNQSIGDVGVARLADGLRRNRRCRLDTLALNMCAVSDVGFRSLLVAIKDGGATWLQHIKLCYNRIGSRTDNARRCGVGATNGEQREPTERPRPASAHYELGRLPDELHRHPLEYGSSPESGWLTGGGANVVPSSTPTRRKNVRATCRRRPMSSHVTSNDLLVEADKHDKQPMSSRNFLASACDARLDSDAPTTAGTAYHRANHRPAFDSAGMTSARRTRTVVDGEWGSIAVKELPALSELPDSDVVQRSLERLDRVLAATESSSVDCEGTTVTWLDAGQLSTPSTDDEDLNMDDDDEPGIYLLLCHVLRANPQLKVLLWGNQ